MKRFLQNSFGKTTLCLLVALLCGGTTWAAEEVYKTALFGQAYSSERVTDYGSEWTSTYDGFALTIKNFKNYGTHNNWYDYLATGQNGTALVAAITTAAPIDAKISKVAVTFQALEAAAVNSVKLYTSTNGTNWEVADNFTKAGGLQTVTLPSPAENLYYRIEVDCATGNSAGINKDNFVKVSKIEFYRDNLALVQAPIIRGQQVFETSTLVTIECPAPDTDADIEYSIDNGYNWTVYTAPFPLSVTTTVIAKTSKSGMESNQASAVFINVLDEIEVDWNLAKAEYITSSTTEVAWDSEDATMTLVKNTSTENANAYLGNGTDRTYTAFYKNQILTIAPKEDYAIEDFVIHASSANDITAGFHNEWNNATFSIEGDGSAIRVTPIIGTEPISIHIYAEAHILAVDVECAPASSPYVTATGHQTVISGTSTGTFDVYYNRLESTSAVVTLCDADGNAASYDWIQVGLDGNKDITFTVTQKNPNTTERTAYAILSVEKDGGHYYTPVIAVTQEAPIPVTISSVGYSTLYYGTRNLIVPEGVTAATYNVVEGKLTQSSTYEVIPKGSGVVLSSSVPDTYYFYESLTADEKDTNNKLRGSDESATTTGGNYYYALTLNADRDPKSVGFYFMTAEGKPFTNGAHKAYLALDTMFAEPGSGVKSYFTLLGDEDPTGIENVNANVNLNANIYNVAGQRMSKMQKGINIINGKKILK